MKKTFLLMAALLVMSSATFAGNGLGLGIGAKVGYQTAKLSTYKDAIKADFSNHFTVGLFGRVNIGHFYIQPEVLYFKTSNVFDVTVTGTGSTNLFNLPTGAKANITLNALNLQVPVLLGYEFLDLGIVSLRAQVGPTANFVLSSKTLYDKTYSLDGVNHEIENVTTEEDFDPKTIAWGLQAGLGADLLNFITLDVNYNFGLSKVFKTLNNTVLGETFDFSNIDNTKQNMFMVTVGIKFLKL
jgi:opacity protein-like surface antigen